MRSFIALYRGINVGGRHSVKMQSLRELHEQLGHMAVRTYIQSGNVVFSASGTVEELAGLVTEKFSKAFGFSANVALRDAKQWNALVQGNPYRLAAEKDSRSVHLGICSGRPKAPALTEWLRKSGAGEMFAVRGNAVYLHTPNGLGTSKFAAGMEKAAGVPLTLRNWRTVEALFEMANA
jgi:uncharacterized protein (DUF1697 family)